MDISDKTLKTVHIIAGIFHLIQAGYGFVLTQTSLKDQSSFNVANPVATSPGITNGDVTTQNKLFTYDMASIAPIFSLMSCANHIFAITKWNTTYKAYLQRGYDPYKWAEYAVSNLLMVYIITALSGVVDIKLLAVVALLNIVLQYTGYTSEKAAGRAIYSDASLEDVYYDVAIQMQSIGYMVFFIQCGAFMSAFFTSVLTSDSGESGDSQVPTLIYLIIFIIVFLYSLFGLLNSMYVNGADPSKLEDQVGFRYFRLRDFRRVSLYYVILSLVAKSFLLNMILFGSIQSRKPTPP
jgi:Heliorhodopsin